MQNESFIKDSFWSKIASKQEPFYLRIHFEGIALSVGKNQNSNFYSSQQSCGRHFLWNTHLMSNLLQGRKIFVKNWTIYRHFLGICMNSKPFDNYNNYKYY